MSNRNGVGKAVCAAALFLLITCLSFSANAEDCGSDYVCQEALIKFSLHAPEDYIDQVFEESQVEILEYFPHTRVYHLMLPNTSPTLDQIAALGSRDNVIMAVPNWIVHAEAIPNDPNFGNLWGMNNSGTPNADIGMPEVWDFYTDGSGKVVAVIDTGIDRTHPDLAANIWQNPGEIPDNGIDDDNNGFIDDDYGWDFYNNDNDPDDDNNHGTHVSGTIGAIGNNGIGVAGVSWNAKLMAVKFLNSFGSGFTSDAIAGIDYAVANGAEILNNSWGGGGFSQALKNSIDNADSNGVIFVAAAGNSGVNIDSFSFYPASYTSENLISVASTTSSDSLSSFSNYGLTGVDLGAPGSSIQSTIPGNSYAYFSGTSMATPHVVGALALVWGNFPQFNHRQMIDFLFQGVAAKSYLSGKTVTGGMLNVPTFLALVGAASDNSPPVANAGADQARKVGETVTLQGSATDVDGDNPLSFTWTFQTPEGSKATLSDPTVAKPTFLIDAEGTFVATLTVSDAFWDSTPNSVTITVSGGNFNPPNIVIRAEKRTTSNTTEDLTTGDVIETGEQVILDAGDTDGLFPDKLLFSWEFVVTPQDSQTQIQDADKSLAFFVPDEAGTYTARLTVDDGFHEVSGEISIVAVKASAVGENGSSAGGCVLGQAENSSAKTPWVFLLGIGVFLLWRKVLFSRIYHKELKVRCNSHLGKNTTRFRQ